MQPTLTIDLNALAANYHSLAAQFSGRQVGAVVKANAYGLGAVEVAQRLIKEGCKQLFVASLEEALLLKAQLLERVEARKLPDIAVFHGPFKGQEEAFIAHGLTPVINHVNQLERWLLKSEPDSAAAYILHVDTGMTRLGLSASDLNWLANHGEHLLLRKPKYLMSHLACANQPEDEKNAEQLVRFEHAKRYFEGVPVSFCNSSGIYLDRLFHGDLARPGSALYGINPAGYLTENPMKHVADLTAPVLMIRHLDQSETIGYGATKTMPAGSKIAIVQMGYADGYLRYLSNKGRVMLGDSFCDIVGRVSMDMIAVDVSDISESELHAHLHVAIICEAQPVDAVAEQAGTIGYEIFTSLSGRVVRRYV